MSRPWALASGIDGKGIVVTGAASGIGRATAELLAASGAAVFAVDRDFGRLRDVVAGLGGPGPHLARDFDLSKTAGIPDLIADARQQLGRLDALVHPAAILLRQPLAEVTDVEWDTQFDINAKAGFFLNRAAADVMAGQGTGGRIVNFASTVWQTGSQANADVYAISKGAVVTLTRTFAQAYGRHGVLVNVIAPGQIDTPMQRTGNTVEALDAATARCPLGRMGTPGEVAAVVAFLVSDHASFVSGATITVSGGATMW